MYIGTLFFNRVQICLVLNFPKIRMSHTRQRNNIMEKIILQNQAPFTIVLYVVIAYIKVSIKNTHCLILCR